MILAAPVWHFWIAPFLVAGVFLTIVAIVGGYLKFVTAKKYPPRGSQPTQPPQ